jgi:hypothetical protein
MTTHLSTAHELACHPDGHADACATARKSLTQARQAFCALDQCLSRCNYQGYEFDDLLGSPLVRFLTLGNLFLQRVAVQAGKLIPFNIRPLLGVRKLESTKARGFIARGYLHYYLSTNVPHWLDAAEESLGWLLRHRSEGYPGYSWGNAFDFASRGGFFAKDLPTVVWTAHIAEAFDLAHAITGKREYRDAVLGAGEFVMNSLERHQDAHGTCLAYAPGKLNRIHNSNLLGAATLLRCWKHTGDKAYLSLAQAAYAWTLSYMHRDGSWDYGVGSQYHWIDNFHTAYNIECLALGHALGGPDVVAISVVEKAYRFWTGRFFLGDGTPKYYHDRILPLDIQCAAEAIETLAKMSRHFPNAPPLADKVVFWSITNMGKPNGAFRFQVRRFWRNDLESIHWGQSTMLSALGAYLYYRGTTVAGEGLR